LDKRACVCVRASGTLLWCGSGGDERGVRRVESPESEAK